MYYDANLMNLECNNQSLESSVCDVTTYKNTIVNIIVTLPCVRPLFRILAHREQSLLRFLNPSDEVYGFN